MLLKILETFCGHTNLHGFIYIVQPSRHKIEKIFWFASILISFILTGILIHKLVLDSQKNPVVIYTDQNATYITDINFPAVSICFGLLCKTFCRVILDYNVVKSKLERNRSEIESLTPHELKFLQILSLVQGDRFVSENFPSLKIPTDDILEILETFNDTLRTHKRYDPFPVFHASWDNRYNVEVTKVLESKTGVCFTFNLPKIEEIYRNVSLFHDYYKHNFYLMKWSTENSLDKNSFPVKPSSSDSKLNILLPYRYRCYLPGDTKIFYYLEYSIPDLNKDGYVIKFHDPYEIISKDSPTFHTIQKHMITLGIVPKITRIDDSLINEDIEIRNCYLTNERELKFFKVYTKVNCEHECLAQMTLDSCGCVQFFMARNKTTKVCGTFDEKCFRAVEDKFEENKSSCKCYDPCNTVNYEVNLLRTEKYYMRDENLFDDMVVKAYVTVDSVNAQYKRKSYSISEFFSFVGGLLGLFAGFSVLSGAEVLYYFFIHPLIELRQKNDSRVYPFDGNKKEPENKPKMIILIFLKEVLKNSSIHIFNQIGSDEKHLIERLIWLILFTFSMISSCFMAQNVYAIYKGTNLIMGMEGSTTKVEDIPFPAVTIVKDLEIQYEVFNYTEISTPSNNFSTYDAYALYYLQCQFYGMMCSRQWRAYDKVDDYLEYPYVFSNPTDIFDVLKFYMHKQPNWFEPRNVTWNGNVDPPFAEVLTSTNFGKSFNLVEMSELLHENETSSNFFYEYENFKGKQKSLNFPWSTSVGGSQGLRVEFDMKYHFGVRSANDVCSNRNTVTIHSPYEMPLDSEQLTLKNGYSYDIILTPEILKVDKYFEKLDLSVRKCFIKGEKRLKFFKIYTQAHCQMECFTEKVYDKCGCVPYNNIRNSTMWLCDNYRKSYCVDQVPRNDSCGCLPTCDQIIYNYDFHETKFKGEEYNNNIQITVRWKGSEYYAMIRYQQFTLVDFLSYLGGILGLFAGISVLSIFELFYFVTLRLMNDLLKFFRN